MVMKKNFFIVAACTLSILLSAQNVSISATGIPPDPSAGLDVNFNDKGLLIPRLTTSQRNSISSPANSLMIFNTDSLCFEFYDQNTTSWKKISCAGYYESPWQSVPYSTTTTLNFPIPFWPLRVIVLANLMDCTPQWTNKYVHVRSAKTSWDDACTNSENVWWIEGNTVKVYHYGTVTCKNIHDGCGYMRFKVYAWNY